MATTLLVDDEIEPGLLGLVREARDWVWLVSPYLQLWGHLADAMLLAVRRGVRILVVVRADPSIQVSQDATWLVQHGIDLAVCGNLHAKIYMSEQSTIVGSMNLYSYSADNSHEVALVIGETDLARQLRRYVTDNLLVDANIINANRDVEQLPVQGDAGFCIRCGERMTFSPSRPLCSEDYEVWAVYRNPSFPENFCHSCGVPTVVSSGKPLCDGCNRRRRQ